MDDGTIGQGEVLEPITLAGNAAVAPQGGAAVEGHQVIADLSGVPEVDFPRTCKRSWQVATASRPCCGRSSRCT